jgi:hypothetical protein
VQAAGAIVRGCNLGDSENTPIARGNTYSAAMNGTRLPDITINVLQDAASAKSDARSSTPWMTSGVET